MKVEGYNSIKVCYWGPHYREDLTHETDVLIRSDIMNVASLGGEDTHL